jgi:Domain of unknown function (DUF1772)
MKAINFMLFTTIVLTGLSAGLGFANAVGYIPAMEDTPANHILSFWQHADHYFRRRMPFFGNAILLSFLITLVMLRKEWSSVAFLLLAFAFLVNVSEMVVIFTQNLPVNKIIETLDAEKTVDIGFEALRRKAVAAFYLRAFFNLIVFALTLAAGAVYLHTHYRLIEKAG